MKHSKDFWANYFPSYDILASMTILQRKKKRKTKKKEKKNKEKKGVGKLCFRETKELFLSWFTQFLCHGNGKRAFSEGDLLAPPTQDYGNFLQDLFFCYI